MIVCYMYTSICIFSVCQHLVSFCQGERDDPLLEKAIDNYREWKVTVVVGCGGSGGVFVVVVGGDVFVLVVGGGSGGVVVVLFLLLLLILSSSPSPSFFSFFLLLLSSSLSPSPLSPYPSPSPPSPSPSSTNSTSYIFSCFPLGQQINLNYCRQIFVTKLRTCATPLTVHRVD